MGFISPPGTAYQGQPPTGTRRDSSPSQNKGGGIGSHLEMLGQLGQGLPSEIQPRRFLRLPRPKPG
jgi:hypothetical protein